MDNILTLSTDGLLQWAVAVTLCVFCYFWGVKDGARNLAIYLVKEKKVDIRIFEEDE